MAYSDTRRALDPKGVGIALAANASVAALLLTLAPSGTLTEIVRTATTNYQTDPEPAPTKPVERKQVEERQRTVIPDRATPLAADVTGLNLLPPPPPVGGTERGTRLIPPQVEPDPPAPVHKPVLTPAKPDPRFASLLQPPYPTSMIRAGLGGVVTVRVLVGPDGRVKAVDPVRADEEAFLAATREQALKKWRFQPATRDGQPMEAWREMTVRFMLPD